MWALLSGLFAGASITAATRTFPHPLGHHTFTADALALIVRSAEGLLRRARNLCLASLIEAVRDQARTVALKQVNRVLLQPHSRHDRDHALP